MIEIHQMTEGVKLDVVLHENQESVEKLKLLDQLVELIGMTGIAKLYPNECKPFLSILCTDTETSWRVEAEDGTVVEEHSGGFSALVDRFDTSDVQDDYIIIRP